MSLTKNKGDKSMNNYKKIETISSIVTVASIIICFLILPDKYFIPFMSFILTIMATLEIYISKIRQKNKKVYIYFFISIVGFIIFIWSTTILFM